MKFQHSIKRRVSRPIQVGSVQVGGDAPISVQTMTNTETTDVAATVAQINAVVEAGADIVRVSVPSMDAADAFGLIRQQVQIEQPLHLGITEAGGFRSGSVKSAIGLGMLLADGIGDTLRVSLAADPVEEVKVGFDILRSLGIRSRGINFIACPSCSRQNFDVIKTMNALEMRLEDVSTKLDVAVIGCIVNGPGEAKEVDVGLTGGSPNNLLYVSGSPAGKIKNDDLVDELERQIRDKVAEKQAAEAQVIAKG